MSYTMYLPSYSIGEDVFKLIPQICSKYGNTCVFIGGKTVLEKIKPHIENSIGDSVLSILDYIWYGGNATYENAERLAKNEYVKRVDIIFGVGGGRAIDTVKYVREITKKPFFTIPTIAATCAAVTKNFVMYYPSGE
ncbi:iron-containing alcohol dehydrogenase [Miniphocaeibacter halophilus]|uniref:iron-containing alcohol dehydrogenase n=1 Tax=Miniphocaeibacter halophilus TaxID=2931922 RepID=UPI001FB42B17|nr:iron-containing alcohol dehydrogenase [Miniphocaeibacter halophilus]